MSAGDRNDKGKATDVVRHYHRDGVDEVFCGQKNVGYSTNAIEDISCKKCIAKLLKIAQEYIRNQH